MEKAMESSQKLGGKILGIGKIHKDGSIDYRELEKSIHNMVVSSGLDYLMMYDGTNTLWSRYRGTFGSQYLAASNNSPSAGDKYGCLQFMGVGTDGHSTTFTDSALRSPVGNPVFSVPFTGYNNCGTYVENNQSNVVRMRLSLQSEAMVADTSVREVGFFGKYNNSNDYTMFSRVVLPSAIEVLTDEKLIVTYELTVTYDNAEYDVTSKLTGLLDSDGNQVHGVKKFCSLHATSFSSTPSFGMLGDRGAISFIQNSGSSDWQYLSGSSLDYWSFGCYVDSPMWGIDGYMGQLEHSLGYSLNSQYEFPTDWSTSIPTASAITLTPNNTLTSGSILDYTPGNFYRDAEITVQPTWGISGTDTYADIYAIGYRGIAIKFGYYDTTDPANPVWVRKPWRKPITQSVKFRFRKSVSADNS